MKSWRYVEGAGTAVAHGARRAGEAGCEVRRHRGCVCGDGVRLDWLGTPGLLLLVGGGGCGVAEDSEQRVVGVCVGLGGFLWSEGGGAVVMGPSGLVSVVGPDVGLRGSVSSWAVWGLGVAVKVGSRERGWGGRGYVGARSAWRHKGGQVDSGETEGMLCATVLACVIWKGLAL